MLQLNSWKILQRKDTFPYTIKHQNTANIPCWIQKKRRQNTSYNTKRIQLFSLTKHTHVSWWFPTQERNRIRTPPWKDLVYLKHTWGNSTHREEREEFVFFFLYVLSQLSISRREIINNKWVVKTTYEWNHTFALSQKQ